MKNITIIAVSIIIISLFYFPVTLAIFPVSNTKNLLAGIGVVIAALEFSRKRSSFINEDLFAIMILAVLISLMGLFSVAYNETPDYAYASYIRTFLIWQFAAYTVVYCIRRVNGVINVEMLCNYLILMCVLQCISVLLIDSYPGFKSWADSTFVGLSYAGEINRMYGLGPSLDVAGGRFAAVLIMVAYLANKKRQLEDMKMMMFYFAAFVFILIVGSMVARTTGIGAIISLMYLIWVNRSNILDKNNRRLFNILILFLVLGFLVSSYLYQTNPAFKENIRFAFEGFFNWWEMGEWKTTSTDRWQTMILWPDNMKTWVIGDGYFDGPSDTDPYYVGPANPGFYKWTDIGYLRFIYYFGLIGLALFMLYFCKVAYTCALRFIQFRSLFFFILLFNFILWFKVSTDLFLVFALFLCISKEENEKVL
jgi:hypothetical protein